MAKMVLNFDGVTLNQFDGLKGGVLTNGCFDILHRGHIELFKFCYNQKKIWQQVVVGVNTDKSVQELKGSYRPIMSLEDRVGVLLAIQWIDYLVTFDTKSVLPLIKALHPDVVVKGGNYSKKACAEADRIVGENFVEGYGGEVMTAPAVEGISTTEIIKRATVPPMPDRTGTF